MSPWIANMAGMRIFIWTHPPLEIDPFPCRHKRTAAENVKSRDGVIGSQKLSRACSPKALVRGETSGAKAS